MAVLSGQEARHLGQVMRAKSGDEVVLFDGSGAEFRALVRSVRRDEVELEITERLEIEREAAGKLTLAVALPKGDRQRWLVEKCTELGVAALIPLQTARSVAQPTDNAIERLRRAVIEASKQCGRNRLMEIAPPRQFTDLIQQGGAHLRLLADPSGASLPSRTEAPTLVTIGPEGGFTPEEVAVAQDHGWRIVTLGSRLLRVETAAIAVASALLVSSRPSSPS